MFSTTVFKHIAPLPTLTKACSNTPNVALTAVSFLQSQSTCLIVFLAQHVDYVPTDEILDALAPQIGIEYFFNPSPGPDTVRIDRLRALS